MQGLRAARNAGIAVPKAIIDKAMDYFRQTTNADGGISYGWHTRGKSNGPVLTIAAIASSASAGEYDSDLVKRWLRYCQPNVSFVGSPHSEYTRLYLSQIAYNLGEDRYAKLFPNSRPEERWTWSKYRKDTFDHLKETQGADGSWSTGNIGPVFSTAVNLISMQLDKASLPAFQR